MMLEGKNLTFIRAERIRGVNKTGKDYDFANITLSDGLESFKIDTDPSLFAGDGLRVPVSRGDKVSIVVDITERFNRPVFVISDVAVAK